MRKAFFALLFINVVYFGWAHWVDVPQPPPVNQARARLPHLKLIDELPPAERREASVAALTAQDDPGVCLSVGPFGDLDNSARAAALLREKGFDPKQRAEEGKMSEGYWVYVAGLKSQAESDRALTTLQHIGIKDALVMPETADTGRRLSLGLYSERGRAERRAQAVRETGLDAEVAEHRLPNTVYWIDLTPPHGINAVPIQDLFAEGVSSRIAVQPCPAAAESSTPAGAVTSSAALSAPVPATASSPPARAAAAAHKVP